MKGRREGMDPTSLLGLEWAHPVSPGSGFGEGAAPLVGAGVMLVLPTGL